MKKFLFIATIAALAATSGVASAQTTLVTDTYGGDDSITIGGDIVTDGDVTVTNTLSEGNELTLGTAAEPEISPASTITLGGSATFNGGGRTILEGSVKSSVAGTNRNIAVSGIGTELRFNAMGNVIGALTLQHGDAVKVVVGQGADVTANGTVHITGGSNAADLPRVHNTLEILDGGKLNVNGAFNIGNTLTDWQIIGGTVTMGEDALLNVTGAFTSRAINLTMGSGSELKAAGAVSFSNGSTITINDADQIQAPTVRFEGATNLTIANASTMEADWFYFSTSNNGFTVNSPADSITFAGNISSTTNLTINNRTAGTLTLGIAATYDEVTGEMKTEASAFTVGSNATGIVISTLAGGKTYLHGKIVGELNATNSIIRARDGGDLHITAAGNVFGLLGNVSGASGRIFIDKGADVTVVRTELLAQGFLQVDGKLTTESYTTANDVNRGTTLNVGADAIMNITNGDFTHHQGAVTLGARAQINVAGGDFSYATYNNNLTMGAGSSITVTGEGKMVNLRNSVVGVGGTITAPIINFAANTTFNVSDTVTLEGDLAGDGKVIVNSGTVLINGDGSKATGGVEVNGGTLGGTGSVGGPTVINTGALNISGVRFSDNLNVGDGVTFNVIGNDMPNVMEDGGTLNLLGPTLTINLDAPAGKEWILGGDDDILVLFSMNGGIFDGNQDTLDAMFITWQGADLSEEVLEYLRSEGGLRWDAANGIIYISGISLVAIPEPSTWLLFGTGVAVLAVFRRRK